MGLTQLADGAKKNLKELVDGYDILVLTIKKQR
jgi:hypothetical protein